MFTTVFWRQTVERAVKTAAQTFLALAGAAQLDVLTADWTALGSVTVGAAVLSVASSLASSKVGEDADPSLV